MIEEFVSIIFAPVFFASIGLRVNFVTHFDCSLVSLVLVLACSGKLLGAYLGARWGGMAMRDRWAVAFAMNCPRRHGDHPRPARLGGRRHHASRCSSRWW